MPNLNTSILFGLGMGILTYKILLGKQYVFIKNQPTATQRQWQESGQTIIFSMVTVFLQFNYPSKERGVC